MKIFLRNPEKFNPETLQFYNKNFEIVKEIYADIIVVNDFLEANYPYKIVARNSTALDDIVAKEIVSLLGEDLTDLTAVAELCLSMAIYTTRIFKGEEIRGKTLGLIGYGRIAKRFAIFARRLHMKIIWHDPFLDKEKSNLKGKDEISLEELLKESNVVSLHITADKENIGFMDKAKFEMMKDGAIFLNSSRDWLVNREDFVWALENRLGGAWEDFYTLLTGNINKYNLVCTNHLGGSTKESKQKSEMILAKKLLRIYGNT